MSDDLEAERELVHVELADHVLTITMDRPEARNALSVAMVAALSAALARLEDDPDCWVGVLQAEGPTFCAGADLKEALGARSGTGRSTVGGASPNGAAALLRRRRKPLIGCVEGQAFAGGLELLLTCDLVVATTDSQFALTEVQRGLLAIGGGLFRLPRRVPANLAMEMVLTGAPVSAEELHQLRFVNRLTAPGEARDAARDLARLITANSPIAVQAALEVAGTAIADGWTDEQGWAGQRDPFRRVRHSEDLVEGLTAFAQKRPPVWKGR